MSIDLSSISPPYRTLLSGFELVSVTFEFVARSVASESLVSIFSSLAGPGPILNLYLLMLLISEDDEEAYPLLHYSTLKTNRRWE